MEPIKIEVQPNGDVIQTYSDPIPLNPNNIKRFFREEFTIPTTP